MLLYLLALGDLRARVAFVQVNFEVEMLLSHSFVFAALEKDVVFLELMVFYGLFDRDRVDGCTFEGFISHNDAIKCILILRCSLV